MVYDSSPTVFERLGNLLFSAACMGLVVLIVAALAIVIVREVRRPHPARSVIVDQPPGPDWDDRPRPGDVWWAWIAYADGTGGKRRPCLIMRTHATSVEVLKITSQDKSHRRDHVEVLDTHVWDPRARYNSYLDVSHTVWITDTALDHRAGPVHPWTLWQARRRHRFGWVLPPAPATAPAA
ncbi:MAG: hypothetical protein HOV76_11295 [Hamadaea sp.]|nr:hypothetical protein [Hamadaea sp.]